MFKAVINAEVFKDAIEAVSTLVDEAKFRLNKDGMTARAVDPANVAMVAFDLNAKAFDSFEASESEIGIDLVRFMDILGMAAKDDKLELNLNEETRKLEIRTGGLAYTLSLLDPSSIRKEPKVPNLDLPAKIAVAGTELKRAVKAAEKVSDHMALGVQDKTFYVEAEGDLDKVRLEIPEVQPDFAEEHGQRPVTVLAGLPERHREVARQGGTGQHRPGHRLPGEVHLRHRRGQRPGRLPARPADRVRISLMSSLAGARLDAFFLTPFGFLALLDELPHPAATLQATLVADLLVELVIVGLRGRLPTFAACLLHGHAALRSRLHPPCHMITRQFIS